mgnify:CR=1 FL=1
MRKANGIITGKPFSLHRRGRVWYAQFKTPAGVWTTARSTRQTSRNRAEAWCVQRLVEGDIITLENITLDQWSRNFFDWDGPWTINRRAAGKRASMRNCLEQARVLTNRILPTLGGLRLADIDTLTIREFRNNLYRNGMSASSINKALGVLRNLLTAADEQGLIRKMPRIEASSGRPRYRGILSVDEARAIFNVQWTDFRGYVASLLAATTGLRASEIQALTIEDLHLDDGYIIIHRAWDERMRILNPTTKSGRARNVIVPTSIRAELARLVDINPRPGPAAFVFFSTKMRGKPCEQRIFWRALYAALELIGINADSRKERNITFHSWRHFANSLLVNAGIPLLTVQALIGHASTDMTRHYHHLDTADLGGVLSAQERILTERTHQPETSNRRNQNGEPARDRIERLPYRGPGGGPRQLPGSGGPAQDADQHSPGVGAPGADPPLQEWRMGTVFQTGDTGVDRTPQG